MNRITNGLLIFAGICLLCLVNVSLQSQDSKGFGATYYSGKPLEEIRLQTDRDFYLAGESIWFSSFCGIINEVSPSPISQILYVEVYNADKKVFLREKFKLDEGKTAGYLKIPEETPTGYYFIRAYTMYLRNFSPENYFISSFTIINPEIPQSGSVTNNEIKMAIAYGIPDTTASWEVAVKIPLRILQKTINALLVNNFGEQLDTLNMYPNGLCLLEFSVVDSMDYFLKFQFKNGDSLLAPLSPKHNKDITIRTQKSESTLDIESYLPDQINNYPSIIKLKIISQAYHNIFESDLAVNKLISIPLSKLSKGLNYIVLVDHNDSIVGFKTEFIENETPANIQLLIQKNSIGTREKVELDIQLPPEQLADFKMLTVSVVKKGTAIINDKFLPEVVIENPCLLETYFEKNTSRSADLTEQIKISLMLFTQDARSSYLNHLSRQKPNWIYHPEIRDVSVSGILLNKKSKEPLKDVQMFASVLFEDFQLHTTKTRDDGSFVFSLNHLTGKHNLYLFPDIQERGEHELLIHNDFSTDFRALKNCEPVIDSNLIYMLEDMYLNQQLTNNFPGGILLQSDTVSKLSPWFGVEMTTIELADYINLASFREVVNEIVPGVRLKDNNGQYRFTVFDDHSQLVYEDPLVLLDHIPVTELNELVKIHPAMIKKFEVMNHPYILGDYTIWGLILITTKTDNFAGINLPEESAFLNYQTRTKNASFVPLKFGPEFLESCSLPFFHTTLYWHPFYHGETNFQKCTFYSSDNTSEFDVVVRGIFSNGMVATGSTSFMVTD